MFDRLLHPLAPLTEVEPGLHRFLDVGVVAPFRRAVFTQDIEPSLRANSSESKMLHASAYRATSRSVFFSPAPPIRIGGCGRLNAWGEFNVRSSR